MWLIRLEATKTEIIVSHTTNITCFCQIEGPKISERSLVETDCFVERNACDGFCRQPQESYAMGHLEIWRRWIETNRLHSPPEQVAQDMLHSLQHIGMILEAWRKTSLSEDFIKNDKIVCWTSSALKDVVRLKKEIPIASFCRHDSGSLTKDVAR